MDGVVFTNNDQVSCFSTLEGKRYLTVLAAEMYDFDKATCSSDNIRLTKQYKVCRIVLHGAPDNKYELFLNGSPYITAEKIADDYVFDCTNPLIAGGFIDTSKVDQLSITPSIDQEFIFITYEGYPINPMTGVADNELQATKWKHYLRRAVLCRGHPTESLTFYLKKATVPGAIQLYAEGVLVKDIPVEADAEFKTVPLKDIKNALRCPNGAENRMLNEMMNSLAVNLSRVRPLEIVLIGVDVESLQQNYYKVYTLPQLKRAFAD